MFSFKTNGIILLVTSCGNVFIRRDRLVIISVTVTHTNFIYCLCFYIIYTYTYNRIFIFFMYHSVYKTTIFKRSCGLRIRFFSSIKKRKLGFCSFNSSQFATSLDWFELTVLHLLDTGWFSFIKVCF